MNQAKLAIFGGEPAFTEALHVGRPNIGNRQKLYEPVADILDRQWLTNNRKYSENLSVVLMCNATIALGVAIRALSLLGEVVVPSFTFIATAYALQWQGILGHNHFGKNTLVRHGITEQSVSYAVERNS